MINDYTLAANIQKHNNDDKLSVLPGALQYGLILLQTRSIWSFNENLLSNKTPRNFALMASEILSLLLMEIINTLSVMSSIWEVQCNGLINIYFLDIKRQIYLTTLFKVSSRETGILSNWPIGLQYFFYVRSAILDLPLPLPETNRIAYIVHPSSYVHDLGFL